MESRDWLVSDNGECQACILSGDVQWPSNPYRLYRFLTEIEDIILTFKENRRRLQMIRPLVRRLLTSSYWLQTEFLEPSSATGFSILKLYEEPYFGLSAEIVAARPGIVSPIHNHGTWAVVLLLQGSCKYKFWERPGDKDFPHKIKPLSQKVLVAGDLISFMPNAIHRVESIGDEVTVSFCVYGSQENQRLAFDPILHTAEPF
ncbi:cupin [Ancylothrix sp. C2]|uniref:cysteine dioxygenase family protein n=1 Tax=Ancylothrix sp. D3o TaxID=2953691 RepID=UPI0021BB5FEA|nr:cupin [Ancylothrix sp. D3o]MCT7950257.1 cupin [Ancylothrix sp. D3o]